MPSVLCLSPHLDDVAFSCGGLVARLVAAGWSASVVTVFTASVPSPTGFALACQLDKGLGPGVDYLALRRAEDERFAARVGATRVHLPFAEAPHRGYESARALFGGVRPDDAATMVPRLTDALAPLARGHDLVLAPQGLGAHVDHLLVVDAARAVGPAGRLCFYRDTPYALRAPALAATGLPPGVSPVAVPLGWALATKQLGCAAYRSQLGFQFGGSAASAAALAAFHVDEARRLGGSGAAEVLWMPDEARRVVAVALGDVG